MNVRERKLAFLLLGALVVVAVGFLFYQLYLSPLKEHNEAITDLNDRIDRRDQELRDINKKKKQLEDWRKLSLPRDVNFAWLEYEKYLSGLIKECEFAADSTVLAKPPDSKGSPALRTKQPIYTRLEFNISGRATLAHLVSFLERFHRTPLLHRIKSMTIQRPATGGGPAGAAQQQKDELRLDLTVEALIVDGAENRKTLLPGPKVQKEVLAKGSRHYVDIAAKNIFLGPADRTQTSEAVEVTQFVKLTDITYRDGRWEAFLYDVYNNHNRRLRPERGFDSFMVMDNQGETLVRGKVERMEDPREIIFSERGKYYRLHVGQTLFEAMGENGSRALSEAEVKSMGLKK
jgi:hypothetical protein